MNLENIDTSFWLTKDKAWMEQRKAQWPEIERVVTLNRKKIETNGLKQYFLRGKMINWGKYFNWDEAYRPHPLDLTMFLWLHPSNEFNVLKALQKCYMESNLPRPHGNIAGYVSFLEHELMRASGPYKSLAKYPFPYMGEKNIILFRVLFNDIEYARDKIGGMENYEKNTINPFEDLGYHHFFYMRAWLLQDSKLPLCINQLYQYDEVVEWSLTTLTSNQENQFLDEIENPVGLQRYQKTLFGFHHFDTEKEGNTSRSRFVHNIRKILDEREFLPEFKQMWLDTKAGKIEVKKPWKY